MNQNELEKCRIAAEQGDAEAQYQLGGVYYNGWCSDSELAELENFMCSNVYDLEHKHKLTLQQERDLLFSAVLMTQNWESAIVLANTCDDELASMRIGGNWGIYDNDAAIRIMASLATADNHTKGVDAKYKAINSHNEMNRRHHDKDFITAKRMLINFGYDNEELMSLPTLAAWDYGRCGFIARHALQLGYIDEVTAWKYISLSAENAAQHYDSWRQYLAAYVLGRALWGDDCKDMVSAMTYLLCNPHSPFMRSIDIKLGHKEAPFSFCDYINIQPDYKEAVKWYSKAAEQGHVGAQCDLGYAYDSGKGVAESKEQAIYWYNKAAEQGHTIAQFNLGVAYCNGNGVEQDQEQAVYWFRKAAEQGDEDAQYNLGLSYQFGNGVEQDFEQATFWYHEAAKQEHAEAQNSFGIMLQNGYGQTIEAMDDEEDEEYDDFRFEADYKPTEGVDMELIYTEATEAVASVNADPDKLADIGQQHEAEQDYIRAIVYYSIAEGLGSTKAQQAIERLSAEGKIEE